jgi:ribosomal protein S18 acetylase RimI-like enzyme
MKETRHFIAVEVSPVALDAGEAVGRLVALADKIWREYFPAIITEAQIDYMLQRFQSPSAIEAQLTEGYRYFFIHPQLGATLEAEPCGYYGVQPRPQSNELFLSKLYVRHDGRSVGAGSFALTQCLELARTAKLKRITLTCNKHNDNSLTFYCKRGFTIIDTVVNDIGCGFVMDDYIMELPVLSSEQQFLEQFEEQL